MLPLSRHAAGADTFVTVRRESGRLWCGCACALSRFLGSRRWARIDGGLQLLRAHPQRRSSVEVEIARRSLGHVLYTAVCISPLPTTRLGACGCWERRPRPGVGCLHGQKRSKTQCTHTRNFVHFKLHSISSHRGLSHAHSELDPAETPRAWHTRVTCCRALVPHAASVVRIVSRSPTQSLHVKSLSSFACLALLSPACLPRVDAVAQLAERAAAHASAGSVVRTRKTFLIANSRNGESTNHYQSATHSAAAASMISPARCDSG